ncbi:hypothetical protein MCETE7_00939 [Acidimicrobiia bacterium]
MLFVRVLAGAIASAAGVLAVVILFALTGTPRTPIGWVWGVLLFVIAIAIAWVSLTLGLKMSRSFDEGASQADARRGDQMEATGRTAGAVVGKGLGKVARIGSGKAPLPNTDTPASSTPKVTVDNAARSIGSMVGRRIAERKAHKGT